MSDAAAPIELTEAIAADVNSAYENGTPIVVGYVDEDGWPRLSYRGTVQVFGPDKLAVWARDPDGGLPRSVVDRPQLTFLYRNLATRQSYVFLGRARIARDGETRARVYESSPRAEQDRDPERKGVALIVDLERVDGISPEGRWRMERAAAAPA